MGTTTLMCTSQDSDICDANALREIYANVDMDNLPILETELLGDNKLAIQHSIADGMNNFDLDPSPMVFNLNAQVPVREEFPGKLNFQVCHSQGSGKNYCYSNSLRKVFINMEQTLPLRFKWEPSINNLWVRASLVYAMDQFRSDPVKRCPNHQDGNNTVNQNIQKHIISHVVRCTHTQSIYDNSNGHFSVLAPLGMPQAGSEYVPLSYQFFCKNSCSSGMNRRPTDLIFTLENIDGEVLGRRALHVRVCSCPKRDKEKEEIETSSPSYLSGGKKRKIMSVNAPPGKRHMTPNHMNDNREIKIQITVPGREQARKVLELAYNQLAGDATRTVDSHNFKHYMADIDRQLQHYY